MSREEELEHSFPWIPWREPLGMTVIGQEHDRRLGCRFCIAIKGIHGNQIRELPLSRMDFDKHMEETHLPLLHKSARYTTA